jgi:hypothetical protein
VSEEYGDNFSDIFIKNIIDSENKIWYNVFIKER